MEISVELSKRKQLAEIEKVIRDALVSGRTLIRQIGAGFIEIRERDLWQQGQEEIRDFYGYCFDAFGMEQRSVRYAMDVERTFRVLENAKVQLPAFESQAVELAPLDDTRKVDVWKRVLELCAEQNLGITVLRVREAVAQEKEDIKRETQAAVQKPKKSTSKTAITKPKGVYVDMGNEDELFLTEKGEEALARIQALCGEPIANAIRAKTNAKLSEESIRKWAEQDDDTVRELAAYVIDRSWALRRALAYVSQIVDDNTQLSELIMMARNRNGRFTGIHGDARITVEIMFHGS